MINNNLHPVMEKVLLTEKQLDDKCKELAKEISEFYAKKYGPTKPVVFLGLLKGCVPFMANLMKYMTIPVRTEYMVVSSYGNNTQSSKAPQILLDINNDIVDYPVLIVEDIIDTGYTLEFIKKHLIIRGASDVKMVAIVNKPDRNEVVLHPDWVGFEIPDAFVVGYGLDCAQRFRNLPFIAEVNVERFSSYDWDAEEK